MLVKPRIDITLDVHIPHVAELKIRTADRGDALYIIDRARKWRKRVGYLPAGAISSSIARGWVWKAELDGLDLGHVLITGGEKTPYVLRHNCVEEDAWNRGIGQAFTRLFLAYATCTARHKIARVRTRSDITAQNIINMKTGGIIARGFEPTPFSNGRSVVEWQWKLRSKPLGQRHQLPGVTVASLLNACNAQFGAAMQYAIDLDPGKQLTLP